MEYTLNFTTNQLQLLSQALGKLPYEQVVKLIEDVQKQIDEQQSVIK